MQRIKEIIAGLLMVMGATVMIADPQFGYMYIVMVLAIVLIVLGIKRLFYYFTMAKYMVDGKESLYKGVLLLDFGALTGSLTEVPQFYVLAYLISIHAFTGLVKILRAREARSQGAKSWRFKMAQGIIDLVMAILCIIFINEESIAVLIYATGIIYSALLKITIAFRRTKFVYIQ